MTYGMGALGNWQLQICFMNSVREYDIADATVQLPKRMIEEFRCGNGKEGMVRYSCFGQLLNRKANPGRPACMYRPVYCDAPPSPPPSPTLPRKFADVDWGSRKINPNKICAECWPGAAFGPYWLLTERLRYETTPLLPALRDRVHVHGQRDVAHGNHRGSHAASCKSREAGASREVELSVAFECRKASPNAAASGPLGGSHLGLMSTKLALAVG